VLAQTTTSRVKDRYALRYVTRCKSGSHSHAHDLCVDSEMDVDSELLAIKAALAKERGDHDDNTCKAHEQKAKQDEQHTNFFEELFGFREIEPGSHLAEPKRVRSMVRVDPQKAHLHFPNGRSFGIGKFRIYTLGELRAWYAKARERGDVKEKSGFHLVKHYAPVQVLHTMPEYEVAYMT